MNDQPEALRMHPRRVSFPEYLSRGPRGWIYDLQEEAGSGPVVYRIFFGDRLLYVGRAKCAWKRLRTHVLNSVWPIGGWPTHVLVCDVDSDHEAALLEARWIDELKPEFNIRKETRMLALDRQNRAAGSKPVPRGGAQPCS